MKSDWQAIQLERPKILRDQIRDAVRDLLLAKQFAPGEKLPSTREFAAAWGTDVRTVHTALSSLEKEGLLVRRDRKGTFVRQREAKLTCVGIYYREDFWANPETAFARSVHAALKEELNRRGIETRVWVDHRPAAEHAKPWAELDRAAEQREIQGLIVPVVDWPHLRWLTKLSIPSAYATSANIPNKVDIDLQQLAELGPRCLAEQGCRSVGFIGPADLASRFDKDGSRNIYLGFFERFTDLAGDLGLRMRNEWMRIPSSGDSALGGKGQERFGYEEMLNLWNQSERPEGLVVYPDTTARGVILGLREGQVRVPEELKVVLHKNESLPLLCPMPATFAVLSEREIAKALIEQVQKQFRGETCQPVRVPFRLAAHRGDSPKQTVQHPNRERSHR